MNDMERMLAKGGVGCCGGYLISLSSSCPRQAPFPLSQCIHNQTHAHILNMISRLKLLFLFFVRRWHRILCSPQIVDTPGLFDPTRSNEEIAEEIITASAYLHPGPHAILYVLQIDRYTPEERDTFMHLKDLFDPNIVKFTIIIFTRGDELKKKKMTLEALLEQADEPFKEVLRECENRVLVFNNEDRSKRDKQVNLLLEMVRKIAKANDEKPYSCTVQDVVNTKLERRVTVRVNQKIERDPNLKKVFDDMARQVTEAKESADKKQKEFEKSMLEKSIIEKKIQEQLEATEKEKRMREEKERENSERQRKEEEERKRQDEEKERKRKEEEDKKKLEKLQIELEKMKIETEMKEKQEQELRKQREEYERKLEEERQKHEEEERRKTQDDIVEGKEKTWTGEVIGGVAEVAGGIWRAAKGWCGF